MGYSSRRPHRGAPLLSAKNRKRRLQFDRLAKIVSAVQAGGGRVMVWGIFYWHTWGPLVSNWSLFKRHSLPEYFCWPCPSLYDYSVSIFWWLLPAGLCTMSESSNHVRLVYWTWQWVHFTQIASTVTRSQSNRAPFGCGGTGDLHHGCAAVKSAASALCYHVNMDQHLWGMFPTPCWNYAMKN